MAALLPFRMFSKYFQVNSCTKRHKFMSSTCLERLSTISCSYATDSKNETKVNQSKQPKKSKLQKQTKIAAQGYGDIKKDGRVYRSWLVERLQQAERSLLLRVDKQVDINTALEKINKTHGGVKKTFPLHLDSNKHKYVLLEMKKTMVHRTKRQIFMEGQISEQPSSFNDDNGARSGIHWERLQQCKNLSDEMLDLYEQLRLSEGNIRCHFFILSLVSQVVRQAHHSVLSQVKLMPFGSVASNLGIQGSSDLDITILCNNTEYFGRSASKAVLEDICRQLRRHPMFEKVIFLRHARVPIVKFREKTTGLCIDLSWNKICGVLFAELLFLINHHEKNFYPLVFTLKHWAHCNKLWNGQAGVSSFMLTMMLIGFLQHKDILPPLQTFYQGDEPLNSLEDSFQSWDKVDFIQTRHSAWALFNEKVNCGQLLKEFFHFYSDFPHEDLCIDLLSGSISSRESNNHTDPMCLWNPLEAGHNICRNVRSHHLRRFRTACATSASKLLEIDQSITSSMTTDTQPCSRLELLFSSSLETSSRSNIDAHVVDISDLFYEGGDSTDSDVKLDDDLVLKSDRDNTYVEVGDKVVKR